MMESIPSNTIHSSAFSFLPNWDVCNGMKVITNLITILSLHFLAHKLLLLLSFFIFTVSSSFATLYHICDSPLLQLFTVCSYLKKSKLKLRVVGCSSLSSCWFCIGFQKFENCYLSKHLDSRNQIAWK